MPAMLQLPNTAGTDGWLTGTAYALQDFRFNPATFETYVCIAAGNSGATVPTGTGDVSDGVCQWRYLYTSAAAGNSTNLTNRSHYDGFVCHGNSVARFGISGLVNHTSFVGLWMLATTEAGIRIGYGWCNYLERVESSFNTGDGIHLVGSSNNATTLNSCKVFANTGKGIYIVGYNALKIVNCTVEANRKTGIDVQQGGSGLSIDNCYFEANAQDGITYSNGGVDVNVKADIILNGTSATAELGRAYPSQGVTISDCFVNALYDNGATNGHPFVMAAAVQGLTLRGNAANTSTVVPYLMGTPGNTSPTSVSGSYGSAESVTAVNNVDFAGALDVAVVGNGLGLSAAWAADHRVDTVESRNIAVSNLGLWSLLTASAGGTFARSAEVFTPAPELPVWELVWATAGGSHLFGYTLDAADFSEFHGKQMLIGCWTRHAFSGDGNAAPYFAIDATSFALTQSNSSVNTWVKWFWSFKMPETGILKWQVRKSGAAGTVFVAAPILCEYGANVDLLLSHANQFVPIAGTITFAASDDTPSVGYAGSVGRTFITAGALAITDFDDGVDGQIITVRAHGAITLTDSANLQLQGDADFVMALDDIVTLVNIGGTNWYETGRRTVA